MDILFENKFIRDKQMAKEVYFHYFFKRPSYIVADILLALLFVLNLVTAIISKEANFFLLVITPLIYVMQYLLYDQTVKMLLKRDKELYGDNPVEIRCEVTEESIKNYSSSGDINELSYSNIKYVAQTKNYILVASKASLIYILKKDGFTYGTATEFIKFLSSKNIKIKL